MPVKKALELGRRLTVPEADDNFNWLHGSPRALTISGGLVTADGADWYIVDTEAAADPDELTRVNGTVLGDIVHLYIANAAHRVIVRDGPFLRLVNNQDFLMDTIYKSILLRSFGGDVLVEISRASVS